MTDPQCTLPEHAPQPPEKSCSCCQKSLPLSAFGRDLTRADGLSYVCRYCKNAGARQRYTPKRRTAPKGPPPDPPRDGDHRQARKRVNQLVLWGRLPHPNTLPCHDCGHIWRAGERRHEYDHHLGYNADHHLCVQAVCTKCHHQRERARRAAA